MTFCRFQKGRIHQQRTPASSPIVKIPKTPEMMQSVSLQDFEIVRVIGKGGFSTVFEGKYHAHQIKEDPIVLNKVDGKTYAMKCMKKDKIRREGKMNHVMNERLVL